MNSLRALLPRQPPWFFFGAVLLALAAAMVPGSREILLYDRPAIAAGEWWRLWTGHWVHFGLPHFFADTGLLALLGLVLEEKHPWFSRLAFALMPPFVSAAIYWFEPDMIRYGGLSALNLGLLLYLAGQGWRRDWTDWFWPAILLIYVGEIVFELVQGGTGGGMIRFDDDSVKVATGAHLASAAYAALALAFAFTRRPPRRKPRLPLPPPHPPCPPTRSSLLNYIALGHLSAGKHFGR